MLHSRLLNIFYPSMFKLYVCVSVISVCIDTCKYANRSNLFYNIFLSVLPCLPTCFSFPCYYTYMYLNRNTPVAVGSDSSGAQYVGSTIYQMTRPKCPSLGQDIYIYTFRSASRFHVPLLCVVVPTNANERMLLVSFFGSQRNEQGLYTMRVEATSCFLALRSS